MKEIFWLWRRDLLQPFCRDRTMLYISICFLAFLEYSSRDCFSSLILATHIGRKIRVEFKKMVAFEEILQEIQSFGLILSSLKKVVWRFHEFFSGLYRMHTQTLLVGFTKDRQVLLGFHGKIFKIIVKQGRRQIFFIIKLTTRFFFFSFV